jgi:hypothetical protein
MRSTTIFLAFASLIPSFFATALAAPSPDSAASAPSAWSLAPWTHWGSAKRPSRHAVRDEASCMTDADAQQVANNFRDLIANYTDALADRSLTSDFTDYSDSVIELINNGCNGPVPVSVALQPTRAGASALTVVLSLSPPS